MMRRSARGLSPVTVGSLVLLLALAVFYFSYTKRIPFSHGFRLRAVFASALNIAPNSPVRIAGVQVGRVTGVARYPGSDAAVVSMDLDHDALPLHADATLNIRPRILLEGAFFVDLSPGSPHAPTISDGATLPITHTADPVQLDQVLSVFNSDARASLQQLLAGLSLIHI